jgi:tetrahydromethanopterin S-methyltransferase subunit G
MENRRMDDHQLNPRFEAMEKRLDRMEAKLDQIVSIETAIREMSIISGTFRTELNKVWDKVDDHNAWRNQHLTAEAEEHASIVKNVQDAADRFNTTTDGIKTEVHAYINQSKGRDAVILWAVGLAQVIILSVTGYQFHSNQDQERRLTIMEQKMEALQK